MKGNFIYYNPTKLYFGTDAINGLDKELPNYGKNILLVYGGGSIKKNGIYDATLDFLKKHNKTVFEDSGVMPNPTYKKMLNGIALVKKHKIDFILAVGGGSVVDYAKAVAELAYEEGDLWDRFFVKCEPIVGKLVPFGCILTMVGTGSEMNGGSVITNEQLKIKDAIMVGPEGFPKFSILNPEYTFSVPKYQMLAGIFDIFSHILEQYMSEGGDSTSDYIAEGLMRSLIYSSLIAKDNPTNYEARANIMWISTWALNTLISKGKSGDWNVHNIAHGVAAHIDSTHGMTLASVSLAYYRHILDKGLHQFKRFAINVWGVSEKGKSDLEIANEGLEAFENYLKELGLILSLKELGAKESEIDNYVVSTDLSNNGFKLITNKDLKKILLESL